MKKRIPTLLIILLTVTVGLNYVSAENETLILSSQSEEDELKIQNEEDRHGELVGASEDGHFNISFDDGYNGYCINYGDHEASEGHNFIVQDTSEAINHESKKPIGNELKTFFVEFYDTAMEDKVKTQHIIWHFSDDFNGWRVDPKLIEEIKRTSLNNIIPDHGAVKKINDTTEAIFDFEVLKSTKPGHQNFFAYKITYRDIREIIGNAPIENNSTSKNETTGNTTSETEKKNNTLQENSTNITGKEKSTGEKITENTPGNLDSKDKETSETSKDLKEKKDKETSETSKDLKEKNDSKSNLKKHSTGYPFIPALVMLLFATLLLVKYKRD